MIANSAVIIGLWPAHFIWTLYCVLRYASVLQLSAQVYFLFFPFIHIMFCLLFFFSGIMIPEPRGWDQF